MKNDSNNVSPNETPEQIKDRIEKIWHAMKENGITKITRLKVKSDEE